MNTLFVESTLATVLWIAIKASTLLAIAALVQLTLHRRASAGTRHLIWTSAVASLLALPFATLGLPQWPLHIRSDAAQITVSTMPVVDPVDPFIDATPATTQIARREKPIAVAPAARGSWKTRLATVYVIGTIALLLHLVWQRRQLHRLAGRAAIVDSDDWVALVTDCCRSIGVQRPVRLLRSRETVMPLMFGIRRPTILLPSIADSWPNDRRRAVVLHELAHVARADCLVQAMAYVACAMYWMHPGVWWVARRLRRDAELACDDRVLQAGTAADEYAGHLLDIAYAPSGERAPALALGMLGSRHIELRMRAALDDARNRSTPGVRACLGIVAAVALLVVVVAAAQPTLVASTSAAVTGISSEQPTVVGPHTKTVEWPVPTSTRRAAVLAEKVLAKAQELMAGIWELRPSNTAGMVHLRLTEGRSSSGNDVPFDTFEGLTSDTLRGPGGPIKFQIRRDAGTLLFEGVVRNGAAAGTFSFTADATFPAELAKRGFTRPTAREQYELARHDIGYAFIDELSRQGYTKPQTSDLVKAGQHGVNAAYVRDLGALGHRLGTLDALITLRDHGVSPRYIRELEQLGYKGLSADALRNARDHGVGPEYVRGMRDAGYGSLSLDALINARDHGVSPEFVTDLGNAGYRKLSLDEVINVRDHGVSPEYAQQLRELGYSLPLDDLIRVRDHGVSVEFVREMAAIGYRGLSMNALVALRDHGVSPEYARELKALGYDDLTAEDLQRLRDHGLSADRIRAANARAGTRLPVDLLIRLGR